jgi:arginyl-tRNA synthetase
MRVWIEKIIHDSVQAVAIQHGWKIPQGITMSVEIPKNTAHGDWSSNVAMVNSKTIGLPPRKIAELVISHLVDPLGFVQKTEIAGPGFINIFVSTQLISKTLHYVIKREKNFGRAEIPLNKKVLVEFVSANPTGPVHVGHARGTFIGDALCRLLDAAGYDVTREYYINDFGKQVETLGRTIYKRYRQLFGDNIELSEGEYPASYVIDIAKRLKEKEGDRLRGLDESAWLPLCMAEGIEANMQGIKETLRKADVTFDTFISEASLHQAGDVLKIVDLYKERGVTYDASHANQTEEKIRREESKAAHYGEQQKGGTFLTTSAHGDDEDRIILRHDGSPVYLTADLAYHRHKSERGYDRMINVLGADHAGHVPRIRAGMALLGVNEKAFEFVLVQIVRLIRDGAEVKVSKRKGTVYELADLIDEAGADACRFVFLSRSVNAQFDFDLDSIKNARQDNPVFYFQYGYARCTTLLRRAQEKGVLLKEVDLVDLNLLKLEEEKQLIAKIGLLPDVITAAAAVLEPHRVLYYCQELIALFHGYYTHTRHDPIIGDDPDKTQARLALVKAIQYTLANAFSVLGISAPEYMSFSTTEDEAEVMSSNSVE